MEYNVHCWLLLGYDLNVNADNKEDAIKKAEEIAESTPYYYWNYGDSGVEILNSNFGLEG